MIQSEATAATELAEGFTLVEGEPEFQPLLQGSRGAVWIDSGNQASTYSLASVDERLLEKVRIGRAFTALQHFSLVDSLENFIGEETDTVVLPSLDLLYSEGQMKQEEAEEMFQEMISRLEKTVRANSLRAVVSISSELGFMAEPVVDRRMEIKENSQGVRCSSGKIRTKGYELVPGLYQTTIGYFQRGGELWEERTPRTATISTT